MEVAADALCNENDSAGAEVVAVVCAPNPNPVAAVDVCKDKLGVVVAPNESGATEAAG